MTRSSPLLTLAAGFTIWAIGFAVIYAVQGAGCAYGWDRIALGPISLLRWILGMLATGTAVCIYLTKRKLSNILAANARNEADHFLLSIATCAALIAIPTTLFTFAGILITTVCG
jgi:hypothetical protein